MLLGQVSSPSSLPAWLMVAVLGVFGVEGMGVWCRKNRRESVPCVRKPHHHPVFNTWHAGEGHKSKGVHAMDVLPVDEPRRGSKECHCHLRPLLMRARSAKRKCKKEKVGRQVKGDGKAKGKGGVNQEGEGKGMGFRKEGRQGGQEDYHHVTVP